MGTGPFPLLMDLIREHSWTPHQKVLTCAPDVERALFATSREAMLPRYRPPEEAALEALMGIVVIVSEDSPPGSWQLVRHDHCRVDAEKRLVTHQDCTIICRQEGTPPWASASTG